MNKKKGISAFFQVSIIMLLALLLQSAVFHIIFSNVDVLQIIENATYKFYSDRLSQCAYSLEKNMVNKWTSKDSIELFIEVLENEYSDKISNKSKLKLSKNIVTNLVDLIKNMGASSCFILLNAEMSEGKGEDEIYFIHDTNEWFSNKNNSDITIELGNYQLASDFEMSLGIAWKPTISKGEYENIDKIKEDVLKKYLEVKDKDSSKLAHWTSRQDLLNTGEKSFVYVYPVIDKYSKKIYGILGIEVRKTLITDILALSFLKSEYPSGFAILEESEFDNEDERKKPLKATIEEYFGDYMDIVANKETLFYLKEPNPYFDKTKNSEDSTLYVFQNLDNNEDTIWGIENKLNIYNKDSYYKDNDWRLVLIFDQRNLEHKAISYKRGVHLSIISSIIVAIISTIIVARLLTSPIKSLVKEIEEMDTNDKITFSETRIKEIKLLKDTIEKLSSNVANTYLQMQNLLELIGHGIVIFEENPRKKTFNRTGRLSSFLQKPNPEEKAMKEYSNKEFSNIIKTKLRDYKLSYVSLEQIKDGTKIIKIVPKEELTSAAFYVKYVKKVVNSRIFHVYTDYTKEYLEMVNLEYEKNHDPLTDLLSRDYFKKCVEENLRVNPDQKAAMLMWDLDNLKFINDMYGHDKGDEYLKKTASIIALFNSENAYVSRFAGDEFFVFLNYSESKDEIRKKVSKIQNKLLATNLTISEADNLKIRASVGICWYPDDAKKYDILCKYADFAMYAAKRSDKGNICEFDKHLYKRDYIILSAKEELNKIIEKKLVKYAFQPIVYANTGEVLGYEALMRPISKILETVSDVMLVAKSQFKLSKIEQLTFECVLDSLEKNNNLIGDKKIFINSIASKTIPQKSENLIKEKLKQFGNKIVIEITEAEEISDNSMSVKQGYKNDYSCMIAIDDFGAGYSSDNSLIKIKPDFIKIDMQLIRNIHNDKEKQQRVVNLIEYSQIIDANVIAEGVECKEELNYLISIGVDYVQGFYIGIPQFDIQDIPDEKRSEIVDLYKKRMGV